MNKHCSDAEPATQLILIEDVDDIRETFALMLELCGCEVLQFANGQSALDSLERYSPRAAIIDLELPAMSGFEVAIRIRQLPRHKNMVLAALTGEDAQDVRSSALASGFDLFFSKPISLKIVHDEIQRLLSADEPEKDNSRSTDS